MKKVMKKLGVALVLAALLAGSLTACGKKEDEDAALKEKLEEANDKVERLEEEDKEEKEFVFREEETGAVLTKYNGDSEEVIIPDEYNGLAVVKIEAYTFKDAAVKVIQIPPTVDKIEYGTLREGSGITIRGYSNTYAENYAYGQGLSFESMGENTFETDLVTIWDKDGVHCTNIYRGQMLDDESLAGVTFKQIDGKSVLVLDNCDIGSIVVEDYAALTIELAEGSDNKITGGRGRDGISTSGNLTIRGNGKLSVFGSDYYSRSEGSNPTKGTGSGLSIWGNLTIEENAKVYAKSGNGKGDYLADGVWISNGNLTVSGGSMLEAVAGETEGYIVPALVVHWSYDESRGGQIVLNDVNITGGGAIVPIVYRGTYEDTGESYETVGGSSISGDAEVTWEDEKGYVGASSHIIIGQ